MFKESTQELPVLILPDWVNLSGSLTFQSWLYPNFREAGQTWRGWFLGTLWVWGSSGGDRQLQLRWLSCFMSPAMCVWPVKALELSTCKITLSATGDNFTSFLVWMLFLSFSCLIVLARSILCWIEVVKAGIFALFLNLEEVLSVLYHWVWCLL